MGVRWVINFDSLDRSCSVTISDNTYSGSPILLTPASNAFTLSRKIPDLYEPILQESGLLSIIDTGDSSQNIDDIHPQNALSRPVSVYYDGQLYWRGYLSPETLTVDYGPVPRIISFPVVGALSVLSSINISGDETVPKSIAYFLSYCLQETGYNWSRLIMTPQLYALLDSDSPDYSYGIPELRLCVSIFNFYNKNDAINVYESNYSQLIGDTLEDCLKKICQFFGWTIIPDGYDIYLSTPDVDNAHNPVILSWSDLFKIAVDPLDYSVNPYAGSTPRPTINISQLSWSGLNHRKTINNGFKRVTISHKLKNNENQFPEFFFRGKVDVHADFMEPIGDTLQYYLLGSVNFLDPTKDFNVELHSFKYDSGWQEITWEPYVHDIGKSTARADLVEAYSDMEPWPVVPKDVDYKTKYLRLCRAYYPGNDSGKKILDYSYTLAKLSAIATCLSPAGGALCLSGIVRQNYNSPSGTFQYIDHEGLSDYYNFTGNLKLSIKIGNLYFNGTDWVNTSSIIDIQVQNGVIKNTNTDEKYIGAQGFIMPIKENIYGRIEIIFHPWTGNNNNDTLFIRDLEIKYFNNDISEQSNDLNLLSAPTGVNFVDSKEISLSLTSTKSPITNPSLVYWNGNPIGNKDIFWPSGYVGDPWYAMPELYLLDVMKDIYSQPSSWLTLETVFDSSILFWSLIQNSNKKYLIVGMETDFADNTTKLYIATYQ